MIIPSHIVDCGKNTLKEHTGIIESVTNIVQLMPISSFKSYCSIDANFFFYGWYVYGKNKGTGEEVFKFLNLILLVFCLY